MSLGGRLSGRLSAGPLEGVVGEGRGRGRGRGRLTESGQQQQPWQKISNSSRYALPSRTHSVHNGIPKRGRFKNCRRSPAAVLLYAMPLRSTSSKKQTGLAPPHRRPMRRLRLPKLALASILRTREGCHHCYQRARGIRVSCCPHLHCTPMTLRQPSCLLG